MDRRSRPTQAGNATTTAAKLIASSEDTSGDLLGEEAQAFLASDEAIATALVALWLWKDGKLTRGETCQLLAGAGATAEQALGRLWGFLAERRAA